MEGLGADKDEVHEPDSHGRVHIMMHTRAGASYSLGPGDPVLEVFVFAQTEVREASEQNINQLCNLTAELKAEAIRDINLITQVHDDSKRPRTGAILSLWGGRDCAQLAKSREADKKREIEKAKTMGLRIYQAGVYTVANDANDVTPLGDTVVTPENKLPVVDKAQLEQRKKA